MATEQQVAQAKSLLETLREHALNEGGDLGSHAFDAHLSLAYACGEKAMGWELYSAPTSVVLPKTQFYQENRAEICAELDSLSTWEFLRIRAEPALEFDAGLTKEEGQIISFGSQSLQYYDPISGGWATCPVPRVRWHDSRENLMETQFETKQDRELSVLNHLEKKKAKYEKDPTDRNKEAFEGYKKYISNVLPGQLAEFDAKKKKQNRILSKLLEIPDFKKSIFSLLRHAENSVRQTHGIGKVGEAWVGETELLYRTRELFPSLEVIHQGTPKWLGRQRLDIWIPEIQVAIEYHGAQHFGPVEFFGGEEAFTKTQERDAKKRNLCEKNGIRLIEISYDQDVSDARLREMLTRAL